MMTMMTMMTRRPASGRPSRATVVAITLTVLGLLVSAVDVWADLLSGSSAGEALLDGAYPVSIVAAGAVVALARPENRIGWALLVAGATAGVGDAAVSLGVHGIVQAPGSVPGATGLAVIGSVVRGVGWFGITLAVPMWFPTGRTLPGRWRRLDRVLIGVLVLNVIGQGLARQAQLLGMGAWTNPLSSRVSNAIADPASLLTMVLAGVGLIFAVAQLVVRYRSSTLDVRRQIGLFAVAAALPICAAPLGVAGIASGWIFQVSAIPLPLAVGYAIVSGGLYEVSTAANRALVWVVMTATIFGVFAVAIGGVGALVPHDHAWLPWLAAAVVATALLPLRDLLQRGVNRVTYGRWEDPQVILGELGRRLAGSADVPALLEDLAAELAQALGLARVAIADATGRVVAGGPAVGEQVIALVAYGRRVGTLRFDAPVDLRPHHRALLGDLASHLGSVMYAGTSASDLRLARERLVMAREEERRRLRRDLHDGLGPALAGHLLRIEVIAQSVTADAATHARLDELAADIRSTVGDVRRVVEGLRPPALDEVGLIAALGQACRRMLVPAGIAAEIRGELDGPLPAAVEVAAYRIVVEAANNSARHSGAAAFTADLTTLAGELVVTITDDGSGLAGGTSPAGGHGMDTMRERAEELGGTFEIEGYDGMLIRTRIPLPRTLPAADRRSREEVPA